MNKISIKFTVVSLFLFLSALIILSMFYIQYSFGKELLQRSINNQMNLLISKVEDSINNMNKVNSNNTINISNFLQEKSFDEILANQQLYLTIFSDILINNKNMYAAYVGFEDDSFFEIINLNIDNNLRKEYNAKLSDRWLLIVIQKGKGTITLLDKNLQKTSSSESKNSYLSTTRPWYKKAIVDKNVIKTKPYEFSNIDSKGVTYGKKIPNTQNVFALDLLISNLNTILKQNGGDALTNSYLIDEKGYVIASSSGITNNIVIKKIKTLFIKDITKKHLLEEIEIDNKEYIYSIVPINEDFLYSYSEVDAITQPYNEKIKTMIFVMLVLMLLIIPIIFYFSSIIVKPISLLMEESKKVKNRDFSKVKKIKSKVLEIDQLSTSLTDMSESISEYQTDLEQKVEDRTIQLREKNKQLKQLSITDKLTGLYNRIKLDTALDYAVEQFNRYNTIFGVIIVDIDFFKSVNDTYGHQVGDTILVEFSSLMKKYIRKTDFIGRWGGEEFMIVCSETSLENMLVLANKLREKIETYNFSIVKHKTASFGVSIYKKGETLDSMIARADQALYVAKDRGRNKVETIEESI
ncbi:diguanylate cyclase [Poseidonibacter lekithochrous]|uniref:sensor domain-containing diguanylate cyclase n=1 Tax=Poseidonibacter TaxID=2321187 RepID=UPI001C07F4CF|nr:MULTISPECIES: diguanylate cyclase [Poseidonibacter]MBU3013964.1 diguanylate cyclase [Poseidonibacter lekithochrous]MDO6827259.1 diguanylate cyclase [Poseidonibacter sp. 1_MG-2023]